MTQKVDKTKNKKEYFKIKKKTASVIAFLILIIAILLINNSLLPPQTITILIAELDNGPTSGTKLTIMDDTGNILLNQSGSNHTINLLPGHYILKATAPYHTTQLNELIIPNIQNGSIDNTFILIMSKDIYGKIALHLPEKDLCETKTITGKILIENTGVKDMTNETLVVDSTTSNLISKDINFLENQFSIQSGHSKTIDFTITLNEDIGYIEGSERVMIRIAGTKISSKDTIILYPLEKCPTKN